MCVYAPNLFSTRRTHFSLSSLLSHRYSLSFTRSLPSRLPLSRSVQHPISFYISLAYIHTHTHSHIFLFIPFIYVVFIKPLWRLPPHFLYLRECEFIEYINNCFLLALRYLIIIYYQWLLKLRISLAAAAVCV